MSIQLSDNIRVGQRLPLESKYYNGIAPWVDVAAVTTGIASGLRFQGLTVNVNGVEYWYKDGIADNQLVIKTAGGSGTVTSITAASPLTGGTINVSGTIGIQQAGASQDGYLSQGNWNTFNNKFDLPALTSGSVLFSNGTTISQNNDNFFWNNTENRLGIGTKTPSYKLHVIGTGFFQSIDLEQAGTPFITFKSTGTGSNNKWTMGNQYDTGCFNIQDDANSTNVPIRILKTSGNVIIGAANASATTTYKLDVLGTFHTTGQNTLGNLATGTGIGTRVVTANSVGLLVNDDLVTNFVKYNDILTQVNYAGRTVYVSPVAMNSGLFSTSFGATTQAQWTISDTITNPALNARIRTYKWKNAYNAVITGFTASVSGTTLTVTGTPPALTTGMLIRLSDGVTGLGYITGNIDANNWTLSVSGTQASQTMNAYLGGVNVYSKGYLYFGFWQFGRPSLIRATYKSMNITTGTISVSRDGGGNIITRDASNVSVSAVHSYWKLEIPIDNYLTDIEVTFTDDGSHYIDYQTQEMVVNYAEGIDIIPFINKDGGKMYGTLSFVDNPDGRTVSTKGSITKAGALTMATGTFTALPSSSSNTEMVSINSTTGVLSKQTIPSGGGGTVTSIATSGLISGGNPTPITNTGTISTSMNTNKLVGRSTAGVGVMEEITLGTGLSFSGTTLNASGSSSPLTTKGDLYTYSTADARLGVGTAGQILTPDAAEATGLKWVKGKTSDLTNDGDNGYTHFISVEDLPSNLVLYATNVASGISTYTKAVSSLTDPDYNTVAVNIPVGPLTSTTVATYCGGIVSSANIIIGNPGIFSMSTLGSIRRTSGSAEGVFFYEVYKRDAGGTESLIVTSDNTIPVSSATYTEFNASALFNNGVFTATDRVVIKFYGLRLSGGSNPSFEFRFGGTAPVRTTLPIPLTVTPLPREILSVFTATAAESIYGIDYIYLVSGTTTITLPTAVGNVSKYTIKRVGTGVVSINTTSSQTIDDSTTPININVRYVSIDLISDGANWNII